MSDDDPAPSRLTAAAPEDVTEALSYALRYDERGKPHRSGADLVASIAAERLVEALREAGFVIMRAPGARAHSTG